MPVVIWIHGGGGCSRIEYVEIDGFGGDNNDDKMISSLPDTITMHRPYWQHDNIKVVEWGSPNGFGWEWRDEILELHFMDPEPEDIQMVAFSKKDQCPDKPNVACPFKIQNACGAWLMTYPIYLDPVTTIMRRSSNSATVPTIDGKKKKKKVRGRFHHDKVDTISGTFVVSPGGARVDFRGVRNYENMLCDWLLLLGSINKERMESDGIQCSIYMLLLKGNLGYSLALKAPINYVLTHSFGAWESASVRFADFQVCDVLEMIDINWDYVKWAAVHAVVKQGKTNMEISRRGGVVMRIVFPKKTVWGKEQESVGRAIAPEYSKSPSSRVLSFW